MSRPNIWFGLAALASMLLSLWIATLPVRILLGKIPDAPTDMIVDVFLRETLPLMLPTLLLLILVWWLLRGRRRAHLWALPLLLGPLATLGIWIML